MAKTIKSLEKEVARLKEELSEQIAENKKLENEDKELKHNFAKFELDFIRVAKEKEKLEKENKRLENRKEEYLNERNDLAAQNNGLIMANNDWRNKCEELKEENHDLDTMVINMKERIKELEEQKKDDWRLKHYNDMVLKCKKLEKENKRLKEKGTRCRVEMVKREMENKKIEEKYEQCFEELSTKLSEESDLDIIRAENEVIKQDKANLLAELTRQINEKSALRKENKRLKKRRREGRYNPKKVYEKLARGWLCYIPEGDYLPTKVHESLIDAMEEGHRLADKTGNQVYIVGTYCKI